MTKPRATELPLDTDTLVAGVFEAPDYADRFAIACDPERHRTVDDVATDWFTRQPRWVRLLSTNSLSTTGVERAIAEGGYRVGSAVGSWAVFERSDDEIVFGDSLGFMEFRTAFRLPPDRPGTAEAATVVRYRWRRTGRFYFALVRPMHRRFIPSLLERTVGT
ncbi:MAG: DUF2867 domain-containing protein [Acidimicrobiales bacterium]